MNHSSFQFLRATSIAPEKPPSIKRGKIKEREQSAAEEEEELNGIGPDDRFHPAYVGINERDDDEDEDGAENGFAGAKGEHFFAQHQIERNGRDIDTDAGRRAFR